MSNRLLRASDTVSLYIVNFIIFKYDVGLGELYKKPQIPLSICDSNETHLKLSYCGLSSGTFRYKHVDTVHTRVLL